MKIHITAFLSVLHHYAHFNILTSQSMSQLFALTEDHLHIVINSVVILQSESNHFNRYWYLYAYIFMNVCVWVNIWVQNLFTCQIEKHLKSSSQIF